MKNFSFYCVFILLICFIYSCEESQASKYNKLIDKALAIENPSDSIFFGFRFNQTKKSASFLQAKYVKQNIFFNYDDLIYYKFPIQEGYANGNFFMEFEQNILRNIGFRFEMSKSSKYSDPDLLIADLVGLINQWYGPPAYIANDKRGNLEYKWIKGIREIHLKNELELMAVLSYYDLRKKKEGIMD